MKLILSFLLLLFTLFLFNHSQAQTTGGKISGAVFDEAKKPLDGATVTLLTAKDSAAVNSLLVKQDGHANIRWVFTRGLGHRKIYKDPEIVDRVADFLEAGRAEAGRAPKSEGRQ